MIKYVPCGGNSENPGGRVHQRKHWNNRRCQRRSRLGEADENLEKLPGKPGWVDQTFFPCGSLATSEPLGGNDDSYLFPEAHIPTRQSRRAVGNVCTARWFIDTSEYYQGRGVPRSVREYSLVYTVVNQRQPAGRLPTIHSPAPFHVPSTHEYYPPCRRIDD